MVVGLYYRVNTNILRVAPFNIGSALLGVAARTGQAVVLAGGAALFLTGDVVIRRVLRIGPVRLRVAAAIAALATTVVGVAGGLRVQLVLVVAVLIAPLIAEARRGGGESARGDAAG